MKLAVERKPLARIMKWAQIALFVCALVLLGYCGFTMADAWIFQKRESNNLDRLLRDRRATSENVAHPASAPPPKDEPALAADGLIGRIEIPRLRLSAVVLEGADGTMLRRAVGHIRGTALPGQPGNVGVAGHRDTFLRPLRDLRVKDEIQLSTLKGDFRYEVESLRVVEPDNVGVLAQSNENVLTIVTCYPFTYIGSAPKRFVARARQVSPQTVPPTNVE